MKHGIDMTDRRDFGVKLSKWRRGRVLSWKFPEFCSAGGARSQNNIFCIFTVPFDSPAHSLQKQFYPKPRVPMEIRDCEGVSFASLKNRWPGKGAEKWSRDHHENWKFAYTITLFFLIYDEK